MRVPFLDLRPAYAELATELDQAAQRVLSSGRYVSGPEVEAFEAEYARTAGAAFAVGVGSGTDALGLGLRALGVQAGDDVLVPAFTAPATWLAVAAIGARPVGVEPDPATMTLAPDRLEAAATARTRAVVPVHLFGRPAPMDAVLHWARARGLAVLADAAQAHGARLCGRPLGALGDAVAWSFYPTKNLGAFGEAGAVTTDDQGVAATVRRLRNYGAADGGAVHEVGSNGRLDELQAALLRVRLTRLPAWNERRRAVAGRYRAELADLPLRLLPADDEAESAWHLFVVRSTSRDAVRARLARDEVETLVHYPVPPGDLDVFADGRSGAGRPGEARRLAGEVLSLPCGPHTTEAHVSATIESLTRALADQPTD